MAETTAAPNRFPPQIPYIIGNEACERFSFYGMKNILTMFLINTLLVQKLPELAERTAYAKSLVHLFMAGVYFFPLIGGPLADRFFGKFRVILWLSLVYCLGHLCLALFEDSLAGFYTGLTLIAVGSGGIKPCVAAMVGDQFTAGNKHLVKKIFAIFYWSINLGSLTASLLIPVLRARYGASVAFGVPGVLMFIATAIFWAGRRHYVMVPATGKDPHSFFNVIGYALRHRGERRPGGDWLGVAEQAHPTEAVEGVRAVLRIALLMLPTIPFFWTLFDQKSSTWVVQASTMNLTVGAWKLDPSQMQAINPLLVMLLIPVVTAVIYPALQRMGWEFTALRRMPIGMVLGAASFVVMGLYQGLLDSQVRLHVAWQLIPYVLLTVGEILVSTTGLEFAYTQAPRQMKSMVQAIWLLCSWAGNLAVAIVSALNVFTGAGQYFFYATVSLVAAGGLALLARRFVVREYYQDAPVLSASEPEAVGLAAKGS